MQEHDDSFEWRRIFRDNSEEAARARKRNRTVFLISLGVTILVAVLLLTVPNAQKYNKAVQLMNNGQYSEAALLFESLKEYSKSEAYYNYCMAQESASKGRYSSASFYLSGIGKKLSKSEYPVGYVEFAQMVKEEEDKARAESEKLARERYDEEVRTGVPFVGMYESDIGKTTLGRPNGTPWHNYNWERGKKIQATIYEWHRDGYVVFSARCLHGTVEQVWDDRRNPWKKVKSSTSSSNKNRTTSSGAGKKKTTNDDPLDAKSYDNPEDFYDDCYDDFFDYEEAEDYYYEHGGR